MLLNDYEVTEPITAAQFEKYYRLRWEVLRKEWAQPDGSEKDNHEADSHHAMITDISGNVLAVGRLQLNTPTLGQIRFMAVNSECQRLGLGKLILDYLEEKARTLGVKTIVLDARENALGFYKKAGYKTLSIGHLLYESIQHYKMEKTLI